LIRVTLDTYMIMLNVEDFGYWFMVFPFRGSTIWVNNLGLLLKLGFLLVINT
jgi:hypothetical protein